MPEPISKHQGGLSEVGKSEESLPNNSWERGESWRSQPHGQRWEIIRHQAPQAGFPTPWPALFSLCFFLARLEMLAAVATGALSWEVLRDDSARPERWPDLSQSFSPLKCQWTERIWFHLVVHYMLYETGLSLNKTNQCGLPNLRERESKKEKKKEGEKLGMLSVWSVCLVFNPDIQISEFVQNLWHLIRTWINQYPFLE